jgi:hypothetical protein
VGGSLRLCDVCRRFLHAARAEDFRLGFYPWWMRPFAAGIPDWPKRGYYAHSIMGFFFGVLHLAYGAYLYLTEKGKNAA